MSRTHFTCYLALLATLGGCRIDRAGLATTDDGAARDAGAAPDATGLDAPVERDAGGGADAGRDEDAAPMDAFVPPVDAGPCPGDGDSDDDGTCDGEDSCPGADDEADEDGDGVPDACDPCQLDGPAADPIPLRATGSGITIDGVQLNGAGNVLVVDPGDTVRIRFAYELEPLDGAVVADGSEVTLAGQVTDAEDGTVPCDQWQWNILLGHDAHSHPLHELDGCETSFTATLPTGEAGTHFFAVELVYRDQGGPTGEPALTGRHGVSVYVR